jgi:hypothetical protein
MNKFSATIALLFLGLTACHEHDKPASEKKEIPVAVTPPVVVDTNRILLSKVILHAFSDSVKKDTFKLTLIGRSILNGKVRFQIIAWDHLEIHQEVFDAFGLLGDLNDVLPRNKEKIDTIQARFYDFFNAKAFQKPALDKRDEPDTDYVPLKVYQDIKADSTAIGFNYAHGYESMFEIAWSKRNKRVVTCFTSD